MIAIMLEGITARAYLDKKYAGFRVLKQNEDFTPVVIVPKASA